MNEQSEIVGVETKAYHYEGLIYVIHGRRLYQVDNNFFLEFMPGNEVYGFKMRQLKKMIPMPHSELVIVLSELMKTIKEII
jgi:hypothetical protein